MSESEKPDDALEQQPGDSTDEKPAEGSDGPATEKAEDWSAPPPGGTVEPYRTAEQIRDAARKFAQPTTRQEDRLMIFHRMKASGPKAGSGMSTLIEALGRQDIAMKHRLLDLFVEVLRNGADVADLADEIAKNLSDNNIRLRQRVGEILIEMGPDAENASMRALGCTRHANEDIRMTAVRILGAIGPCVAKPAVGRLEAMLREPRASHANREEIRAALEKLQANEPAPKTPVEKPKSVKPAVTKPTATKQTIRFDGLRILIAEDTAPMRQLVAKLLTKSGATVTEAQDGMEAIDALTAADSEGEEFDLILLDLMMPRLNGLSCLQRIRKMEGWEKVPVICMSAVKEKQAISAAAQLGIADYILKPFTVQKVLASLRRNIENGVIQLPSGGDSEDEPEAAESNA